MRIIRLSCLAFGTALVLSLSLLSALANAQSGEPPHYWTAPADLPLPTVVQAQITPSDLSTATYSLGEGYLFLSPYERRRGTIPYSSYAVAYDNNGEPVFYVNNVAAPSSYLHDFKVFGPNQFIYYSSKRHSIFDSSYNFTRIITPANGIVADFHDIDLTPEGTYLFLVYSEIEIDMSEIVEDGDPEATYVSCHIREVDPAGNLLFEWRSEDHLSITDTYDSLLSTHIDGVHCNSVDVASDGHLLVSNRDHYEVVKINRQSGEVIWRLGGKQNQFEFVNAIDAEHVVFEKQHDARQLENGNISIFDNRSKNYSRSVEYELDEENLTATLVWEDRLSPNIYASILGNTQRLPNGNTVTSWGSSRTTLTEVAPDDTTLLTLTLPSETVTYRSYRFPWHGKPTTPPDLVVVREMITGSLALNNTALNNAAAMSITHGIHLAYSWNGATDVATYRVYADTSPVPQTLIDSQEKSGFETITTFTDPAVVSAMLNKGLNFRIVPLDASGSPFPQTDSEPNSTAIFSSAVQSLADALVVTATPTPTQTPSIQTTAATTPQTPNATPTSVPIQAPIQTLVPIQAPTPTADPNSNAYFPSIFQQP